ncbi:MAG: response regulator [Desulfobacterales bacterium]|nr:response regulator [Desulfobacterales bacterium]
MIRKVLIVDDDQIWLRLIKKKFENFSESFETVTAIDGMEAVQKLKERAISLVVTDLQMPHMDGLTLLAHLSEQYPDIPVIIMTAYSSPNSKKSVLDGGAAGYIEKPFVVEDLAEKIKATLEKESEGGTLQTVPLDMFIQLIEMEQKTCTIRIRNKATGKQGVLFFNNGNFMEARYHDLQGTEAAYKIFAWDKVTLSIQDDCTIKEKRIEGDLQAILFDAIRMKDEATGDSTVDEAPPQTLMGSIDLSPEEVLDTAPNEALPQALMESDDLPMEADMDTAPPPPEPFRAPADQIRDRIASHMGQVKGINDIYRDSSWDNLLAHTASLGQFFDAGSLKSAFIAKGDTNDYIILPGKPTTVVAVGTDCPRDRLLNLLNE